MVSMLRPLFHELRAWVARDENFRPFFIASTVSESSTHALSTWRGSAPRSLCDGFLAGRKVGGSRSALYRPKKLVKNLILRS